MNVDDWGSFRLGDLFEVRKGKRLTKEDQTEGTTPYVGAIDSNNGVSNRIGQGAIHDGGTISLSYNGSVGEAFFQPDPFWATDDVNVLYPKAGTVMDQQAGLFVCTILRQERYRYSYGRKWVLESMKDTIIRLPKTSYGTPNWQAMSDFMAELEENEKARVLLQMPYKRRMMKTSIPSQRMTGGSSALRGCLVGLKSARRTRGCSTTVMIACISEQKKTITA